MTDPVRRALEAARAAGAMPGACWWVEEGGTVLSRGAMGLRVRVPVEEPADEDTPYDLASLTKPLATALLAAMLEDEGRLDLAAPLAEVLPELGDTPWSDRTALEFGAHSSGLPAWAPLSTRVASREEALRAVAALPPVGPRGRAVYSDLGYVLLGVAVERAGGAPLDRLFEERIAGPLGLPRAGFAVGGRTYPDAAATETGNAFERRMAGPEGDAGPWRTALIRGDVHDANAWALGGVAGHAGLFATAAEVAAMAALLLERPRRLLTPVGEGRTFGLVQAAFSEAARGVLPDDAPGHTGFTGTSVWLEPARGRIHVLLANRVHPTVPPGSFQPVRAAFHEAAASLRAYHPPDS